MRKATTTVIATALVGLLVAGCGDGKKTEVGAVTAVHPLCVGRAAATGTCFTATSSRLAAALRVGTCVQFSFDENLSTGPSRLISIVPVQAAAHRNECPR